MTEKEQATKKRSAHAHSSSTRLAKWTVAVQSTWQKDLNMEVAALVALTLLLGALVIIVAIAVGRRKEEIREEQEQAAEFTGKSHRS